MTVLGRIELEPKNFERHRFVVRLISYLAKDYKENEIANPAIRLLVPAFTNN